VDLHPVIANTVSAPPKAHYVLPVHAVTIVPEWYKGPYSEPSSMPTDKTRSRIRPETAMSEKDLRKVEAFLLNLLKTSEVPLTPEELVARGQKKGSLYSEDAIRKAVWSLVESGKVVFAQDWSLQSA